MKNLISEMPIAHDEIHVWVVHLAASELQFAILQSVLDRHETQRASHIPLAQQRRSFVVAHGVLRCLLGRYLAQDPAAIELVTEATGKPQIASPANLQFNMTRSGEWAAFAFSSYCTVGVDVERLRTLPELPSIIRRVLCAEEAAELMLLHERDRERGFTTCWTRKEAYSKAVGLGLLADFEKFCVAAHPDRSARIIHIGGDTKAAEAWVLDDLPMPAGYAGALAYPGSRRRVSVHRAADLDGITCMSEGRMA